MDLLKVVTGRIVIERDPRPYSGVVLTLKGTAFKLDGEEWLELMQIANLFMNAARQGDLDDG